jgi:hypothetical protein
MNESDCNLARKLAFQYQQGPLATSSRPESDGSSANIDAFLKSFASSAQSRSSVNSLEPTLIRNSAKSGEDTGDTKSVAQTSQTATAAAPAPIGLPIIQIIPPTDPILKEFAEEYLPYFDNYRSDEDGTGGKD